MKRSFVVLVPGCAMLSALALASCSGSPVVTTPDTSVTQSMRSLPTFGHSAARVRTNVQTETVLHSFGGDPDGAQPEGALLNVGGTLYGVTKTGGASNLGAVYSITPSGQYVVYYSFSGGTNGAKPYGRLVNVGRTLYGTTSEGGASGTGTVFSIRITSDPVKETVLHSFGEGSDGKEPNAGPVAVNTDLYGTTRFGGTSGDGTVFKITTAGEEKVIYNFTAGSDGAYPGSELLKVGSLFYGTTTEGGTGNYGIVFSVSPTGTEAVLHTFSFSDGADPIDAGGLIDQDGALYGTTAGGGTSGYGSIFKISIAGSFTNLYNFKGSPDGLHPVAGLTDVDGTLFGVTTGGGNSGCGGFGCGVIFALLPRFGETVFYSFTGEADGDYPYASMVNVGGTLYGTTSNRSSNKLGTIFSLSF
jgi:uncharacterized repeat protein (TIGR03803 family)